MRHHFIALATFLLLPACKMAEQYSYYDKITKLKAHEYQQGLLQESLQKKTNRSSVVSKKSSETIPVNLKQKVTLSTTEMVALKDIFMQIAQQAKVDSSC